jgi:hypothetical protein
LPEPSSTLMRVVPLDDVASARSLADQASIYQDLSFVVDCCRKLSRLPTGGEAVLVEALWSAALIAYSRCFGTGKRIGLDALSVLNLGLQGDVWEFHQWLRDMRDKGVAGRGRSRAARGSLRADRGRVRGHRVPLRGPGRQRRWSWAPR